MSKITDTSRIPFEYGVTPASAILAAEAAGQQELVQSTSLPIDGSEDLAILALGITFGPAHVDDSLFREATLPAGWKKVASTEHSMWSYILDADGKRRVAIFYKAAFYDRRAFMHIVNK